MILYDKLIMAVSGMTFPTEVKKICPDDAGTGVVEKFFGTLWGFVDQWSRVILIGLLVVGGIVFLVKPLRKWALEKIAWIGGWLLGIGAVISIAGAIGSGC